jgi:uncharacterized protein (TIRG00374 family)
MTRARLFYVLRILFVVALLATMVVTLNSGEMLETLRGIEIRYFGMAFLFLTIEATIRSVNWGMLLRCKGHALPLHILIYAYVTGSFYGFFVPSSFGTDVSRAIALNRQRSVRIQDAAVSVVALNVLALLCLCTTAAVSSFGLWTFGTRTPALLILGTIATGGLISFLGLYLTRGFWIRRLHLPGKLEKVKGKIVSMIEAFTVFGSHPVLLVKVTVLNFLIQILAGLTVYSMALAIGSDIPFLYFLLLMPMVAIARLVPASVANFGGEQGVFVFLFSLVNVAAEEIFLISMLLSTVSLLFILAGGLVYLAGILKQRHAMPSPNSDDLSG